MDLSNNMVCCQMTGDIVAKLPHVVVARHRCTALKAKESIMKPKWEKDVQTNQ